MSLWRHKQGPRVLAWVAITALLAGCNQELRPTVVADPADAARSAELANVLSLAARLGSLSGTELQTDLADTSRRVELSGRPADKVRLALLLSRPGAPLEEVAKARSILVGVANSTDAKRTDPMWSDFAAFHLTLIEGRLWQKDELSRLRRMNEEERLRLEEERQRREEERQRGEEERQRGEEERQRREEERQRRVTLEQKTETLEQKTETLEQQRETLEKQLEAVKTIEKKIDERAPARSVPPPAIPPPRKK